MTPEAKRQAVSHLCAAHGVSERRAFDVLRVDRSTVRYQLRRGDDADLRKAIKRVSRERRRFGYRRIHVMVEREGHKVNHKKLRHIYPVTLLATGPRHFEATAGDERRASPPAG